MKDYLSVIQESGIGTNESKIYYTLLHKKQQSVLDIARSTKLQRSSVYNAITQLVNKGLVAKTTKGARVYYSAIHPRRLQQIAQLKLKTLQENLPQLSAMYAIVDDRPTVKVLEGMEVVKSIYRDFLEQLKSGDELYIATNIGRVLEVFPEVPETFISIVGSLLYKSPVKELVTDSPKAREYIQTIEKKKKSRYEVRMCQSQFPFGDNETFIYKDRIIIFSLTESGVSVIQIDSADIARSYRSLFLMAWEHAGNSVQ